jgi:ubiquinone/menaquinone biosynthesis C-methylase UbiE
MHTNFDPLAHLYRYLEFAMFGRALWRRRIVYLPQLNASTRVLMAGEGDGRFLAAFLQENPLAQVDYFDSSAKMLALARRRTLAHLHRVRYFQVDFLDAPQLHTTYNAVVTHFFLDCFTNAELDRIIPLVAQAADTGAYWVVSEFSAKSFVWRILIRGLYFFFGRTTGLRVTKLPSYHQILSATGFRLIKSETSLAGLLISELWVRRETSPLSHIARVSFQPL